MALATIGDVKRLFRDVAKRGGQRISIGETTNDHMSESDVQRFLNAQETYVKGRLGFDPGVDPLVVEIHANITCYHLWIHLIIGGSDGEIPTWVLAWYQWAMDTLQEIVDGAVKIGQEAADGNLAARSNNIGQTIWEEVTLEAENFALLDNNNVVPGSVKVFYDKTQMVEYANGYDFEVVPRSGEIRRTTTGRITEDQKVYVNYFYKQPGVFNKYTPNAEWAAKNNLDYGREDNGRRTKKLLSESISKQDV